MEKGGDRELKHLGFVRILALNALVLVSYLYEFAKDNSGPLKSPVGIVEKAVPIVVSPVYELVKGIPEDVLVFVDNKVDEAFNKFDKFAPPLVKKVVYEVHTIIEKVWNLAKNILKEFFASGLKAAISYVAVLSMQFAMRKLAEAWFKIHQNPALHAFVELVVPTTALLLEKYNNIVVDLATKSYAISSYLPLVPVEEMANVFKQVEAGVAKKLEETSSDILAGVANKLEETSSDILTGVANKLEATSSDILSGLETSSNILTGVANKLEATSSDILSGLETSSDILAGIANKLEATSPDILAGVTTSSDILVGVANKVEATSSDILAGVATSSDILTGITNKVETTTSGILAGVANKVEATSSSIFKW